MRSAFPWIWNWTRMHPDAISGQAHPERHPSPFKFSSFWNLVASHLAVGHNNIVTAIVNAAPEIRSFVGSFFLDSEITCGGGKFINSSRHHGPADFLPVFIDGGALCINVDGQRQCTVNAVSIPLKQTRWGRRNGCCGWRRLRGTNARC